MREMQAGDWMRAMHARDAHLNLAGSVLLIKFVAIVLGLHIVTDTDELALLRRAKNSATQK